MASGPTVDDVVRLAGALSAVDKLRVIERLAPQVEAALSPSISDSASLDEQYQKGYEQTPEDTSVLEALLPHLPAEKWE